MDEWRTRRRVADLEARQRQQADAMAAQGGRGRQRGKAMEHDVALLVQVNRALLRLLVARGTVTLDEVRAEMARGSDGDITGQDLLDEFGLPPADVDPAKRFSAAAKRRRPRLGE